MPQTITSILRPFFCPQSCRHRSQIFSAQNSFAPLKVDELDNDKFYDLSAGAKKPGLSDILLQIAFNIQNKEGGDSRFINILPRYKRNSPHQLLICNDLHGAFNLLVKTPVEGGLLNVKTLFRPICAML